jgi:hypothetical protein
MHTTFGALEIDEQTYWDRFHKCEIRPVSTVCALRSHAYSLRLQRVITDFAADTSFERASDKVKEHYDVVVPVSSCRAIALDHASSIGRQLLPEPSAKIADTLIVEADGSMVPIVSIDETADGDHRKHRTLSWKEAKLSLVHCAGEKDTLVAATFDGPKSCGEQMYGLAESAGLGKATRIHAVGDGAPWIADQVDTLFGRQGHYLVDFFHVCEYLAPVAAYSNASSTSKCNSDCDCSARCWLRGFSLESQAKSIEEIVPLLAESIEVRADEFAQQVGIAQRVLALKLPIGRPAIVHQNGQPFGQNSLRFDRFHPASGVDAVPSRGAAYHGRQPMQLSHDPQTRFIGMSHRRQDQGLGNPVYRGFKQVARLSHPREQGRWGNFERVQVVDQLRGAPVRQ